MISKLFKKRRADAAKIIEEIHETFYTEVDRLLAEANVKGSESTDKEDLIKKSERLSNLGFRSAAEVREAEDEIKRLEGIRKENVDKDLLIEAIRYFSFKYPQYKFITEDSVRKICEKYGLIYGDVNRYVGKVPDKNLADMMSFKVNSIDECWYKKKRWSSRIELMSSIEVHKYFSSKNKRYEGVSVKDNAYTMFNLIPYLHDDAVVERCGLEIAAPASDFDTRGMEIKNKQLVKIDVPDPIVLQPIFFKGLKHYLIVTAWGLEASDEAVVNERKN